MTDFLSEKKKIILELLDSHPRRGWYGSELVEHSGGHLSRFNIYTLLSELVEQGLVREEEVPPEDECTLPRTKHHLTEGGRRILLTHRNATTAPATGWLPTGLNPV